MFRFCWSFNYPVIGFQPLNRLMIQIENLILKSNNSILFPTGIWFYACNVGISPKEKKKVDNLSRCLWDDFNFNARAFDMRLLCRIFYEFMYFTWKAEWMNAKFHVQKITELLVGEEDGNNRAEIVGLEHFTVKPVNL